MTRAKTPVDESRDISTAVAINSEGRSIAEEWCEIVLCMGMLIDRVDRLVERSGCKSRRELMLRLGGIEKARRT